VIDVDVKSQHRILLASLAPTRKGQIGRRHWDKMAGGYLFRVRAW
jgi:hypothetical protein